jgi:hypothetical protein
MTVISRLLFACMTTFIAVGVEAKVIGLNCFYRTYNNPFSDRSDEIKDIRVHITIDTAKKIAKIKYLENVNDPPSTAKLETDNEKYWFKVVEVEGVISTGYFIDRHSLAFMRVMYLHTPNVGDLSHSGECSLADIRKPQI